MGRISRTCELIGRIMKTKTREFVVLADTKEETMRERIRLVEIIFSELGASLVEKINGTNIYKYKDNQFCVVTMKEDGKDWICIKKQIAEGSFLVCEKLEYDYLVCEFYGMVRRAFNFNNALRSRYPYGVILAEDENYVLYNEWEDTYLIEKKTGKEIYIDGFYGDPDMGYIDVNGKYVAVDGFDEIYIYFTESGERLSIPVEDAGWGYNFWQDEKYLYYKSESYDEIKIDISSHLEA